MKLGERHKSLRECVSYVLILQGMPERDKIRYVKIWLKEHGVRLWFKKPIKRLIKAAETWPTACQKSYSSFCKYAEEKYMIPKKILSLLKE